MILKYDLKLTCAQSASVIISAQSGNLNHCSVLNFGSRNLGFICLVLRVQYVLNISETPVS